MSDIYFNSQAPENGTNVRVAGRQQQIAGSLLSHLWRWMPGLTRKGLMRFFMATGTYTLKPAEAACLEEGRPFRVPVHDKQIQAWRWGQGPGLLMVHGWGGRGAQFFEFVAPAVQAGYSVIVMDGPGHGLSSGRTTSYFEFTDTVRAFLQPDQGLDVQGLVGHSFGASAIINALEKEQRCLPAVCIAPIIRLQELLHHTMSRFGVPTDVQDGLIQAFEAQFNYDLTRDNPLRLISRLVGSMLIIHDDQDHSAPYADSRDQAGAHDHVNLVTTQGLGHRRILGDPEVIRTALAYIKRADNDPNKGEAS